MDHSTKELYIIGAGGFGREVADTVREINKATQAASGGAQPSPCNGGREADGVRQPSQSKTADLLASGPVYRIVGFVDDDESRWGTIVNGIEIKGGVDWLRGLGCGGDKPCAVITIADPQSRETIVNKLDDCVVWENIVHPLALITSTAAMGRGNIIQHFASLNSNASIGDHCIINSNSVIGHDVILNSYVSIMHQCGLMGYCVLKKRVYVGASAVMIQDRVIGEDAVVGAGAIVIRDVEAGATVVGNPARRVK